MTIAVGIVRASLTIKYRVVKAQDCHGFGELFRFSSRTSVDSRDTVTLLTRGSELIRPGALCCVLNGGRPFAYAWKDIINTLK